MSDLGTVKDDFVFIYYGDENIFTSEFPNAQITLHTNSASVNINGDDAVRIISADGTVVDQFGNEEDGTGEPWEYKDGYAVRNAGTTPSGTFVVSDWTIVNGGLDGQGLCNGGTAFGEIVPTMSYVNGDNTPTCNEPSNLTSSNITSDSATINWASNNSSETFELILTEENVDPNTDDTITVNNATTYTFTNLEENTTYVVYVRSICEGQLVSEWDNITFITEESVVVDPGEDDTCADNAEVIGIENFDNSNWTNNIESLLFIDPTSEDQGLFIVENSGNNPNFSGNILYARDLKGEGDEPSLDPFVFTFNEIDVSNYTNVLFSFDYFVKSNDDAKVILIIDGQESEHVWFNDANIAGKFTQEIGEATTFDFRIEGSMNGASDTFELDNIQLCGVELVETPICDEPTDLTVSNITTSEATISWTTIEGPNGYQLIVVDENEDPSNGTITNIDVVSYTINNLDDNTTYDVYVRSICGNDSFSAWVKTTFTTDEMIEAPTTCNEPTGIVLNRLSDTTSTFVADDKDAVYQGTANRVEHKKIRPYPLYGMTNMHIPHIQTALVPDFAHNVWLRIKCDEDLYSDWVGPYVLPTYQEDQKAVIYPNPAIGNTIKVNGISGERVEVYNMSGNRLMNLPIVNGEINLQNLTTGKYHLRIIDIDGKVYEKALIKK
ncbi:T9SS type A sorting domain-containing protein [Flavobacteriaceae bacterium Ap0902]|nr:T9SS type A sorting domain-containing protein [Flavobacteriaceae bacterium Ap0902]